MIVGSTVSLQVGAALATHLFADLGAAGTTIFRLGLAAVIIGVIARPRVTQWDRRQWTSVLILGATMAGMNATFYAAIERIPLGIAVAIELLGPLTLAAALSRRAQHIMWVAFAVCGIVALGVIDSVGAAGAGAGLDSVGVLFAICSAVFWAAYIPASAKVGERHSGVGPLAVALGFATLLVLPFGLGGAVQIVEHPGLIALAVTTAVLASVFPYGLELMALRRLSQRVFGVLASLEPVMAAVAGWLILGQQLSWPAIVAIGAVMVGAVGTALGGSQESAPEPAVPEIAGVLALPSAAGDFATADLSAPDLPRFAEVA